MYLGMKACALMDEHSRGKCLHIVEQARAERTLIPSSSDRYCLTWK